MEQSFVNGSTLLGTAIAVYSFSVLMKVSGIMFWIYLGATFFFLITAGIEYLNFNKVKRK